MFHETHVIHVILRSLADSADSFAYHILIYTRFPSGIAGFAAVCRCLSGHFALSQELSDRMVLEQFPQGRVKFLSCGLVGQPIEFTSHTVLLVCSEKSKASGNKK